MSSTLGLVSSFQPLCDAFWPRLTQLTTNRWTKEGQGNGWHWFDPSLLFPRKSPHPWNKRSALQPSPYTPSCWLGGCLHLATVSWNVFLSPQAWKSLERLEGGGGICDRKLPDFTTLPPDTSPLFHMAEAAWRKGTGKGRREKSNPFSVIPDGQLPNSTNASKFLNVWNISK